MADPLKPVPFLTTPVRPTEYEAIDAVMASVLRQQLTPAEWWLLTSTQTEQRDASARYGVPIPYIHRQRARLIRRLREQYEEGA